MNSPFNDMTDQEWEDVDGGQDVSQGQDLPKPKRKSAAGRSLVRWSPELDQLVLLCVDYVCVMKGVALPYDEIASHVESYLTGEGLKQHLAKLTKARAEAGQKVPPKLPKSARRINLKENRVQDEANDQDTQPASSLLYHGGEKKKKRQVKTNVGTHVNPVVSTQVNNLPGGAGFNMNGNPQAMQTPNPNLVQGIKRKAVKMEPSNDDFGADQHLSKKVMTNSYMTQGGFARYQPYPEHNRAATESQIAQAKVLKMAQEYDYFSASRRGHENHGVQHHQQIVPAPPTQQQYIGGFDDYTPRQDAYNSGSVPRCASKPYIQAQSRVTSTVQGQPGMTDKERQESRLKFMQTAPLDSMLQWDAQLHREAVQSRGQVVQSAPNTQKLQPAPLFNFPSKPHSEGAIETAGGFFQANGNQYDNARLAGNHVDTTPRFLPTARHTVSAQLFNGQPVHDPSTSGLNATLASGNVDDGVYSPTDDGGSTSALAGPQLEQSPTSDVSANLPSHAFNDTLNDGFDDIFNDGVNDAFNDGSNDSYNDIAMEEAIIQSLGLFNAGPSYNFTDDFNYTSDQ